MNTSTVMLGDVPVGDGHPAVFVTEVGTFFNQDIGMALDYLDKVAAAGAHVFKTEILHDPDVCVANTGLLHRYNHAHGVGVEDYRALMERKVVPLEDYRLLFEAGRARGIPIMASVYDRTGVDFVRQQGGSSVKIARNNIDNVPLIRYAAASGLPVVLDMGHVTFAEVAHAVDTARAAGASDIIVNLHPGSNPAPPASHHLRTANTIKAMFGCPVGLSCHYRGEEILYAAVGAGVNLLEKGVDADPDRPEQDLVSALSLADLAACVARVRACWEALGTTMPEVRQDRDLTVRAGLVAARDLRPGDTLRSEDLSWAFPPVGIWAADFDRVIGRRLTAAIAAGTPLTWTVIDLGD